MKTEKRKPETKDKTASKNIKDAIRNIILKTEEKTITGDALREALFKQGHTIAEVNVKISLMRSKGDLLLESGIYKLGNQKSITSKNTKSEGSVCKSVYGFANNSDVAIVNANFQTSSTAAPYTRNGVPINLLFGSLKTFTKTGNVRKDILLNTGISYSQVNADQAPQLRKKGGFRKKALAYMEQLSTVPSIERVLIKSSVLEKGQSCSFNNVTSENILKHVRKTMKRKAQFEISKAYKHSLISCSKSDTLNLIRCNYETEIYKLRIKRENNSCDWSVLAEKTQSEIAQIARNVVIGLKKYKENYDTGRTIKKTDKVGRISKNKNLIRLYGECTYAENCELKSIEVTPNLDDKFHVFKSHILTQHFKMLYGECQYCAFPITTSLKVHARRMRVNTHHLKIHFPVALWPYTCNICDAKFIERNFLRDHLKKEHSGNLFACFICGPTSNLYSRLRGATGICGLALHLKNNHDILTSSANYQETDGKALAKINFKAKNNSERGQELLKEYGYKLDHEYPEEDFAINYNSGIEAMFENMIK
jgi:hypothetical protein